MHTKPDYEAEYPTRAQIYDGALNGLGLELGYSANMIDLFTMEVQGGSFIYCSLFIVKMTVRRNTLLMTEKTKPMSA